MRYPGEAVMHVPHRHPHPIWPVDGGLLSIRVVVEGLLALLALVAFIGAISAIATWGLVKLMVALVT
jgi:hypothetical protein